MLSMKGQGGSLLPIQEQKIEANPMIMYICSTEFISFERFFFFFMWDKWILLLAVSPNFKADSLWIMQMIGIRGLLPTQEHEKKDRRGRITANWHGRLLCAQGRAKIKHLNYSRVHSIREQAGDVLKFSWPTP